MIRNRGSHTLLCSIYLWGEGGGRFTLIYCFLRVIDLLYWFSNPQSWNIVESPYNNNNNSNLCVNGAEKIIQTYEVRVYYCTRCRHKVRQNLL